MYFTPIAIDFGTSRALRPQDIFARLMNPGGIPVAVFLSSLAFSDAPLCIIARSCRVSILQARSLLKTFAESAVARAVFIYKRSFASPTRRFTVAAKRVDSDGSAVIIFSKLWNHHRSSEPRDVDESSFTAGAQSAQYIDP
jgi:hypothetical protein